MENHIHPTMGNTRSSEHSSTDWLAKEPLASHIDAYMQFLATRDYAANTFSNYLGVVIPFPFSSSST